MVFKESTQSSDKVFGVIGAGAVGSFYGAHLHEAGNRVVFFEEYCYDALKEEGLSIVSKQGNINIKNIEVVNDLSLMPQCDCLILALKSIQLSGVLPFLSSILKADGSIVVIQNGLGVEAQVAEYVNPRSIIGAAPFITIQRQRPSKIMHLGYGLISLAAYTEDREPGGITAKMDSIYEIFQEAKIETALEEDLLIVRWQKLLWNIPFNALSVSFNANSKQLINSPNGRQVIESLMKEIIKGAASQGRIISGDLVHQWMKGTENMEPYPMSMRIDYDRKRPMEIKSLIGEPLRCAQKAGVQMPILEFLYNQLKFLEQQNAAFLQIM